MDNPPADLQAVFRVMNEWQSMHTEADLYTIQGTVPLLDLGLSLPHDINAYPFSRYASKFIRDHRLGITEGPIRFPFLLKITAQDSKDAVELFRMILSYMFDREPSEERHLMLANYIVQRALSSEHLRDEIYVQLVNQTFGQNPRGPHSAQLIWTLLASCLSAFPPSTQLANHLLKYVSDGGTDGYDAVCQHKLLQCIGLAPELARSYPPCLLEWTTNRTRGAMALYGSFFDGEKGISQVESWTTAEEFAVNMFRSRRITDRISGWCVQLRDDVDTYECAGYDYVLDLIGEMELPPYFPCSIAYFLTMTDLSRSASTTGRQHWPGEPHNTERLRVMPLEVEELADQPIASLPPPVQPPRVMTPPPRVETPLPPPPPSSPPPKKPSVVEEHLPTRINPEDVYLLTEQAMSQKSALNKRKERIPEELSKKSVLNTRYASSVLEPDPEPVRRLPTERPKAADNHLAPPPQGQRKKLPTRQPDPKPDPKPQQKPEDDYDMGAWVDNIFKQALSGQVQDLGSNQAVARNLKGGGDAIPVQYGLGAVGGGGGGGAYGFAPFGMQPGGIIQSPAAFAQPSMGMLTAAPGVLPTFGGHALQGGHPLTAFPAVIDPTVQIMQEQQFLHQQQQQQVQQIQQQQLQQQQLIQHLRLQQQQQLQMHQQAADLQAQLQMKELEKQVLASSLQAEMLRQQLDQMQGKQQGGRTQTQAAAAAAPPASETRAKPPSAAKEDAPPKPLRPHSVNYDYTPPPPPPAPPAPPAPAPPRRAPQHHYQEPPRTGSRVQGEVDESRPGGVNTLKRSYLSKSASNGELRLPSGLPAPMANHAAKQAAAAAAARAARAKAKARERAKEVKFADETDEDDEGEEEESVAPPAPSPPIKKKESRKAKQPLVKKTLKPVVPVVKAGSGAGAKADVPRPVNSAGSEAMNGEPETRKAPGRIGVKWPPESGKSDDRPNAPVNRLVITERKEERQVVRSRQSADEVHEKIRKRIQSSQGAAEREAAALRSQPAAPANPAPAKTQTIHTEDSGTQYVNWSNVDMATKRKELERMLKGFQHGPHRDAAHPLPPLPPLPPPSPPNEVVQPPPDQGIARLDHIRTTLRGQSTGPFYTYKNRDWSLEIKKEVFSPLEKLNNPILVDLVFAQVVIDVLSGDSIRLSSDDKRKMKKLLDGHGVNLKNVNSDHRMQVKKAVIKAAKDLPIFFCRLFPVNGGSRMGALHMVGVSHSGVRLLVRSKDVFDDTIIVIEALKFADIVDVHVPKTSTLLMRMKGRNIVFYTKYATQMRDILATYRREDSEIILQSQLGGNFSDDDEFVL